MKIEQNIKLDKYTTLQTGGNAEYFATVITMKDLERSLEFAWQKNISIFILGGGSNILVGDGGYKGLVLHNKLTGLEHDGMGNLSVFAGHSWDEFVKYGVENGLQGIECLSGIPGTVGAAPVQNIGAYGQSAGACISEVFAIDIKTGNKIRFTNKDCSFGYRKSIFNTAKKGFYVIYKVNFTLNKNSASEVNYLELVKYFKDQSIVPLTAMRDAVIQIRSKKGMVILEGFEKFKSAGSFFKNPVISDESFRDVEDKVSDKGGCQNWAWPTGEGYVKVSAACLIQLAGYERGFKKGRLGISPYHSLCLVNLGGATSSEVIDFSKEIIDRVYSIFGVTLTPEVQFVGNF